MRSTFRTATIVLACLLIPAAVYASGVALTGIGARATALGGSYHALASDWSAAYWNPAGLTQIQGFHAGFDVEMIKVRGHLTPAPWDTLGRFSVFRTTEVANKDKTFYVPAGGVAYGMGRLAFGLAVFAPFGLGATWDLLETEKYHAEYPKYDYDDDLKVVDVHPTVALQLSDNLSVGVGVSLVYSSMMIRKPGFIPNPYLAPPDPSLQTFVKIARFEEKGLLRSPYTHFILDSKLEGDGFGWGGNLGLLWKPSSSLSIGLTGQWYHDLSLDGEISASLYFPYSEDANNAIQLFVTPKLQEKLQKGEITEEEYVVVSKAYSGEKIVVYDKEKGSATVPLPPTLALGFAYTGIPNTTIAADITWTGWSAWDVIRIELDNGDVSELKELWKDTIRLGVAVERRFQSFCGRLAYYTEPEAPPASTLSPTIPDVSRRHVLLLGIGVPLGPITLNLHAEKFFSEEKDVREWRLTADGTDYENVAGKYRLDTFTVMFGIDYNL